MGDIRGMHRGHTVGLINVPRHRDVGHTFLKWPFPNSLIHLPMSQFASFPKGQAQLLISVGLGLGKGHSITNVVSGVTSLQDASLGGPMESMGAPSSLHLKHLSSL